MLLETYAKKQNSITLKKNLVIKLILIFSAIKTVFGVRLFASVYSSLLSSSLYPTRKKDGMHRCMQKGREGENVKQNNECNKTVVSFL